MHNSILVFLCPTVYLNELEDKLQEKSVVTGYLHKTQQFN